MNRFTDSHSSTFTDELNEALARVTPRISGGIYAADSLHSSSRAPSSLAAVFLASLANVGASKMSVRVIVDGRDEHPSRFLTSRTGDGLIEHSAVRDRSLHHYLSAGATVVFDHVNEYVPQAQEIQEFIEATTGGRAWIQCYVTQASTSAFHLHGDDHPFLIVQLHGRKQWKHGDDREETPDEIIYQPGDVAFYPKGTLHDVSGLGELSVHLTIAFEGYEGLTYAQSDANALSADQIRRVGTGLPYSLAPKTVDENTPARFALRHEHTWDVGTDGKFEIYTGYSKVRVHERFLPLLHVLLTRAATTPAEAAAYGVISLEDAISFYQFGFAQGLLLTGSRERL